MADTHQTLTQANTGAGGPKLYVANRDGVIDPPEMDDSTGYIDWSSESDWDRYGPLVGEVSIKFAEEDEDVVPVSELWRIFDLITARGLDTVSGTIAARDVDLLSAMMSGSSVATTAAAASQAGLKTLTHGSLATITDKQACIHLPSPAGFFYIWHLKKVRITGDFTMKLDQKITKVPINIKCFAREGDTAGEEQFAIYQCTAAKTE